MMVSLVSIIQQLIVFLHTHVGLVQTLHQSLNFNVESNLDIIYAMVLVTGKQNIRLYQVGDILGGQ
jgi:hypothetical protein